MDTLNLESIGPSVPTSSVYFTSTLPLPANAQPEAIQMKDMGHAGGNDGVEVAHSGHESIGYGELRIKGARSDEE